MTTVVQNYRTNIAGKKPTGLKEGQIAVNMATGNEALYIQNAAGTIVEINPTGGIPEDNVCKDFDDITKDDKTKSN